MQRVERSAFHHRIQGGFGNSASIGAITKVEKVLVKTIFLALRNGRARRGLARARNGLQTKSNMSMQRVGGISIGKDNGEIRFAQIDIRRSNLNANVGMGLCAIAPHTAFAILQIHRPILKLARLAFQTQHRRHIKCGKESF